MVSSLSFVHAILCLLAVPFVIATPALLERAIAPVGSLVARQSGLVGFNMTSIPSACQSDCSEVMKLKDCGVDTSCLCTDTVSDNIAKCLNCFVTNDNQTLPLKDAQTNMDTYVTQCSQALVTVKAQKLGPQSNGGIDLRPEVWGLVGVILSGVVALL
ncbi:hypothetical protein BDN71DRAFT_1456830 [Pleurotus eryngii]|uniref:Extracellular membrane protein CFEM domain-containing protein n=1 Tax=Pleurotus eryngii TaxID=5323 RepID=A0A9P5ZIW7_PLEER|nr:hypothetical protein BDN71DRAFT_1456830 [Pleurotus eryngii]